MKANVIEGPRRQGEPAILLADTHKTQRELGWFPRYASLDEIIEHAWLALH